MKSITGIKIVWGFAECPKLPEGYALRLTSDCHAKAIDPNGNEFLIALDPPRLVPKIGAGYDFKKAILI